MLLACMMILLFTGLNAGDWPRWRGLQGTGISTETGWNAGAISGTVPELWRIQVGDGWSAVSVSDGRLYTMGNEKNQDIVVCLDAKTGKDVWRYQYDCAAGNYPGPRSTPVVDDGLVYTVSREGDLFCLDALTGKVKWKHQVCDEFGASPPTWGIAGSILVENDLIIVNAGVTGMAFDKKSGKMLWGRGGTGGYSTPVAFSYQGRRLAALFGEVKLHVVDMATGATVWSHDWVTSWNVNAADPVIVGDGLFVSSGYGRGAALLQMSGKTLKTVWENRDMSNQFSSSIYIDGYLYGIDGNVGSGDLKCIDFKTGQVKWSQSVGFGSLISAAGTLIVLNEKGDLRMVKALPGAYQEIASAKRLLKPQCWTAPVLSNGLLYLRNSRGELLALDLRK